MQPFSETQTQMCFSNMIVVLFLHGDLKIELQFISALIIVSIVVSAESRSYILLYFYHLMILSDSYLNLEMDSDDFDDEWANSLLSSS